jgi:hypothetical protein
MIVPDSTGKSIPISFFHVTRLIIARLANNPNYDEVVEKNYKALEESFPLMRCSTYFTYLKIMNSLFFITARNVFTKSSIFCQLSF